MNESYILFGFAFGVIVLGAAYRFQLESMHHKERIAMIEKGIPLPGAPKRRRRFLRPAILFLFLGISLTLSMLAFSFATRGPYSAEQLYYHTLGLKSNGMPAETIAKIEREMKESYNYQLPPEAAIFGLLPFMAGAIYLILHLTDKDVDAGQS